MIWLCIAALALLSLVPAWAFARRGNAILGRQEAAISLHRAQLQELDRDLADGRLVAEEHASAKLEVQRRLLSDAALTERTGTRSGNVTLALAAAAVPALAVLLYLRIGHPEFPPQMPGADQGMTPAEAQKAAADDALINTLRARLRLMNPHADQTLDGYTLLGRAELSRGHLPAAAEAWQVVLADRFDPTLAVQTAEVLYEAAGHMTQNSLHLFKRALAEAPADAPWRPMAEKRVALPVTP